MEPTLDPSPSPTGSPTTPSPTHPGELICGNSYIGAYNGETMNVEVRMPYDGDMTMDCSASDFEIEAIIAYDSAGAELSDTASTPSILTIQDVVHDGDYSFMIQGAAGISSGTFDCEIKCSSAEPTPCPSTDPTPNPTIKPTGNPTAKPTVSPNYAGKYGGCCTGDSKQNTRRCSNLLSPA